MYLVYDPFIGDDKAFITSDQLVRSNLELSQFIYFFMVEYV